MRRRRIRLGKVDGRERGDGAHARSGDCRIGKCRVRGTRHLRARRTRVAGAARRPPRDDLPGADDGAQSADAHRRPDRRGVRGPRAPRRSRAPRPGGGAVRRGGASRAGADRPRLPVPALRRAAAARDDRHGAGARARRPHRRRADHRARRHHPGPDPRPHPRSPAPARHGGDVHHPRLRRRRRDRRPRHRHAPRRDRRERHRRRGPQCAPSRLHQAPPRGRPVGRRAGAGGREGGCAARDRAPREDVLDRRRVVLAEALGQGGGRCLAGDRARRGAGARRRIGVRQVHGGTLHRAPGGARRRRGPPRWRRPPRARPAGAAQGPPPRADGVPGPLRLAQPAHPDRPRHRAGADRHGHVAPRRLCRGAPAARGGRPRCRRRGALPARILRRPAPAHRHRPCARHAARTHHRRRGGLRARRVDPGPDPRPSACAAGRVRPVDPVHHPRPQSRGAALRPHRGDAAGQDRRARACPPMCSCTRATRTLAPCSPPSPAPRGAARARWRRYETIRRGDPWRGGRRFRGAGEPPRTARGDPVPARRGAGGAGHLRPRDPCARLRDRDLSHRPRPHPRPSGLLADHHRLPERPQRRRDAPAAAGERPVR